MSNLAIIPVRQGSKRLQKKNTRSFFGRPMFAYTLDAARESGLFDKIHVSTESEDVAKMCSEMGLSIDFMRPHELATDEARLNDVCAYIIKEYGQRGFRFDNFCILWATAPMRTAEDIQKAYSMLKDDVEAVIGVSDYNRPVYVGQKIDENGNLTPLFSDMLRQPRSKMPKVICDNGSMCWVRTEAHKKHDTWLPPKLKGYYMPRYRSVDIDTQEDWDWAEYCYTHYFNKTSTPG